MKRFTGLLLVLLFCTAPVVSTAAEAYDAPIDAEYAIAEVVSEAVESAVEVLDDYLIGTDEVADNISDEDIPDELTVEALDESLIGSDETEDDISDEDVSEIPRFEALDKSLIGTNEATENISDEDVPDEPAELAPDSAGFTIVDGVLMAYDGYASEVVIPEGVTCIAERVFHLHDEIVRLTLPDSLQEIGDGAFELCSGLTFVKIPSGVKRLPDCAFFECRGLTGVELPDGLQSIGYDAFFRCALVSINIPDSVESIGRSAFEGCSFLTDVRLPKGITALTSAFRDCFALREIVVPEGVRQLTEAFCGCKALERVDLPKTLTALQQGCFSGCTSLKTIIIRGPLSTIGSEVFYNCGSLESIELPDAMCSIGNSAFTACKALREIRIPGNVKSIGTSAFQACSALGVVTLEAGLQKINDNAFSRCGQLSSIVLPDTVTYVGENAFEECALKRIVIPASVTYIGNRAIPYGTVCCVSSGSYAETYCNGQGLSCLPIGSEDLQIENGVLTSYLGTDSTVVVPEGVTAIGEKAFLKNHFIQTVVLPDGLKTIGNRAFSDCDKLTSINLPWSVTEIGTYAFSGCECLRALTLPPGLKAINAGAFSGCGFETITIPDGVVTLEKSAFARCPNLKHVTLPEGLREICEYAFYRCGALEQIQFPGAVQRIYDSAFQDCIALTSIEIPGNVWLVGGEIFRGCTSLQRAIINAPVSNANRGGKLFCECTALTDVTLPVGWRSIASGDFYGCSALETISLPQTIQSINSNAFQYCSALRQIRVPGSVREIGQFAFANCTALTDLILEAGLQQIGEHAFYFCSSLETVAMPDGIRSIGTYTFECAGAWTGYVRSGGSAMSYCQYHGYPYVLVDAQRVTVRVSEGETGPQAGVDLARTKALELWLDPYNKSVALEATVEPNLAMQDVAWKTSNKKIVDISANGRVTAKKAGSATVWAVSKDRSNVVSEKIKITVKAAPTSVTLKVKNKQLSFDRLSGTGDQFKLEAKLSKGSASTLKYSGYSTNVISVAEDGTVTAVGIGSTKITVKAYNGKKATCTVKVKAAPEGITLSKSVANLNVKATLTLKATLTPTGAFTANTFASSDPTVASVNGAGKVTAKRPGTAVITVTSCNGLKDKCVVMVWRTPSKVKLDHKKATLAVGQTLKLNEIVYAVDANPEVRWSTSASKLATVDQTGLVTALKPGRATITVKTSNGKKATCKITIKAAPKSLSITAAKTAIGVGETTKASAKLTKNSYSPIVWRATDVASIDASGNVTGLSAGTAVVTASTFNGLSTSIEIIVLPAPDDFALSAEALTIKKGKSVKLRVLLPEGTAGSCAFKSSNAKVATVNAAGKITGKKKGKAVITATLMNGLTRTCVVTVK